MPKGNSWSSAVLLAYGAMRRGLASEMSSSSTRICRALIFWSSGIEPWVLVKIIFHQRLTRKPSTWADITPQSVSTSIMGVEKRSQPSEMGCSDWRADFHMPYLCLQNHGTNNFITLGKGLPKPTRMEVYRSLPHALGLAPGKYFSQSLISSRIKSGLLIAGNKLLGLLHLLKLWGKLQNGHPHLLVPQ